MDGFRCAGIGVLIFCRDRDGEAYKAGVVDSGMYVLLRKMLRSMGSSLSFPLIEVGMNVRSWVAVTFSRDRSSSSAKLRRSRDMRTIGDSSEAAHELSVDCVVLAICARCLAGVDDTAACAGAKDISVGAIL